MKVLLVVDMQNDFVEGGALAVPGGRALIPVINQLIPLFERVVGTQDWHPKNHKSFVTAHQDHQPFDEIDWMGGRQTLWPEHCVQGSFGAQLCDELHTNAFDAVFRKGMSPDIDSYSAFYDNAHLKSTGLSGYLHGLSVSDIYFSGLCADICVYHSIIDALNEGFRCHVYESATCALNHDDWLIKRQNLIALGVQMI